MAIGFREVFRDGEDHRSSSDVEALGGASLPACGGQSAPRRKLRALRGFERVGGALQFAGELRRRGAPDVEAALQVYGGHRSEGTITRIAPVTEQIILSFIAEKVLDQPQS